MKLWGFWGSGDILGSPHKVITTGWRLTFRGEAWIEVRLKLGLGTLWLSLGLGFGSGSKKEWKINGNECKVFTNIALQSNACVFLSVCAWVRMQSPPAAWQYWWYTLQETAPSVADSWVTSSPPASAEGAQVGQRCHEKDYASILTALLNQCKEIFFKTLVTSYSQLHNCLKPSPIQYVNQYSCKSCSQ